VGYRGEVSDDVRRVARGAGILLPATLLGNAALLGLDFYLNGALGNADYGLFGAVRRVLGFVGFIVLLGMENTVVRFVALATTDGARADGVVRRALYATGAASIAAAVVLWALAPAFAAWVDPSPTTVTVLRVGALSVPLASVRMVAVAGSQGWGVLTHRAVVMFVAWPVAQLVAFLAAARLGRLDAVGAAVGYTAAMGLGALIALGLHLRRRPELLRAPPAAVGPLIGFAWPMWLYGVLMAAYTWADQVLLAGLRSPEQAGWYGPVATLAPLFGLGLASLNGVFAPIIAEKHAAADRAGLERLYRLVTRWAVLLALPPVLVCLLLPSTVLHIWPNGSDEAVTALRVTAVAQLVCTGVGSVNYLLIMAGHQRATLWNGVPALVLNFGLSFLLVPAWGVTGAAWANAAAMGWANLVGLLLVVRLLGVHPFDRALVRVAGAAGAAAVPVWLLGGVDGPPAVVASAAGVLAGGVLLGVYAALGLGEDDRMVVGKLSGRFGRR